MNLKNRELDLWIHDVDPPLDLPKKITAKYIIITLFISWINYGTNEWKKIAINEFISPLATGTLGLVWL